MNAAKTLSLAAVVMSLCVTLAYAQKTPEETITKVVPIAHADARNIADAIATLGLPVAVTAAGPQMLILQGPQAQVSRVIEDVVGPMETPQTRVEGAIKPVFIPLSRAPNKDFYELLETVAPRTPSTRVAVDRANRLLVIRGGESQVEAVRRLVSELDRPAQTAMITAYFLKGFIEDRTAEGSLPSDLAPIAETLSKSGVHGATLLAPLIVKTKTGEHFSSDGHLQPPGSASTFKFEVEGRLDIGVNGDVELQIRGMVTKPRGEKTQLIFAVETTVQTRTGSYVILAAAPGTTNEGDEGDAGDCVALVVRVEQAQ